IEGQRGGVAPGVLRHLAELRQHIERIGAAADRYPAVAIGDCALRGVRKAAADNDRWMRFLYRLRPLHHLVDLDELAGIFRLRLRPDCLHRLDALAHELETRRKVGAVVGHLLGVPAAADAEYEAAGGKPVDGRDLLRGMDRIALYHEADAGRELDLLRHRRRGGEREEGI